MEIYEHKVQYYETDQMKVVHHSNYIRWFEECRIEMMERGGLGYEKMEEEGIICPVASVNCRYETMTKFGEVVQIIPTVEKFNGIRLVISYEVREKRQKNCAVPGRAVIAFWMRRGGLSISGKQAPVFIPCFLSWQKNISRAGKIPGLYSVNNPIYVRSY